MPTTNQELAKRFQEMADVLQLTGGDSFRVAAFQKVARVLSELGQDVADIGPDPAKLTAIDGVGKGTAGRIAEFLKTGKIKEHDELVATIPPGLRELLQIPGLGPKTIALLWKQAGITSLADLKKKLEGNELADLPGMGAKKLENLRKNLDFVASTGGRVRIGQALPVARWFVEQLRSFPGVKEAAYAGSLRRGRETIGDVDLLVAAQTPAADEANEKKNPVAAEIMKRFLKLEPVKEVLGQGPTKASVRTAEGLQVDLRVVPVESFGAALLYFSGSKEHNIHLRERAIKMGMKLNEYGLTKGENQVAGKTEEEVYRALKLHWIPPEQREVPDEIAKSEKGPWPDLVTIQDIHAELHAHTTASDGTWSIRELVSAAMNRGFHTIAVTDHSKSQVIANGLTEKRLEEHIANVRAVAAELKGKIHVLTGSEVDILADGSLDYPNSLLKELDVVVASPHAALSQEPEKATKRLLKALNNPYITIMGHPTGRLVNRREGLHPDIKALVTAAAARGVALEINANHYRLDLRDSHAQAALEAGCLLSIDTDAHGPSDLDELIYGVLTARRAGAKAKDVINCLSREQLIAWIKKTKKG